jgi:hypothetical protein
MGRSKVDTIQPIVITQRKASGTTVMTHTLKRLTRRISAKSKTQPIFCFTNYVISPLRIKRITNMFTESQQVGQIILLTISANVKIRMMKSIQVPKVTRFKIPIMRFIANIRTS